MCDKLKLRVWHIVNPPRKPRHYLCDSVEEAIELTNRLITADLRKKHIWGNAFGLEIFNPDEADPKLAWEEYYDPDDGRDIREMMDEMEEEEENEDPGRVNLESEGSPQES